ncbi:MAG TPA: phosphocholine cytidylyltransferase family protein [Vicinamibacterales bacterium]|nr:phosphocholine cytidylyltransferase family protein [Vicinamibacterales bacterium]
MRGIILAAGKGSRLNGTIGDKPKCLLRVGGKTLVERQIETLRSVGIDDIVIVVGCQADQVRRTCGSRITYVENTKFAQTNSLYSLWMARPLLYDGFVVMNCDVLFHPQMLTDLVTACHDDALLIAYQEDDAEPFGDEEMKIRVSRGRVRDIAKTLPAADADGENVGVVKFGRDGARLLASLLDQRVAAGGLKDWAPRAFGDFARIRPLHAIGTRGYPWTEIDFPEDYERAVRDILPAIEGDDVALASDRRPATAVIEQPDATIVVRAVRMRADTDTMPLSPASGE